LTVAYPSGSRSGVDPASIVCAMLVLVAVIAAPRPASACDACPPLASVITPAGDSVLPANPVLRVLLAPDEVWADGIRVYDADTGARIAGVVEAFDAGPALIGRTLRLARRSGAILVDYARRREPALYVIDAGHELWRSNQLEILEHVRGLSAAGSGLLIALRSTATAFDVSWSDDGTTTHRIVSTVPPWGWRDAEAVETIASRRQRLARRAGAGLVGSMPRYASIILDGLDCAGNDFTVDRPRRIRIDALYADGSRETVAVGTIPVRDGSDTEPAVPAELAGPAFWFRDRLTVFIDEPALLEAPPSPWDGRLAAAGLVVAAGLGLLLVRRRRRPPAVVA
jgi:hypothetical protein